MVDKIMNCVIVKRVPIVLLIRCLSLPVDALVLRNKRRSGKLS